MVEESGADRGFIAPLLNDGDIEGVFEATAFNFMQGREAPPEVNPSLWRHAQLVNRGGLCKVTDNIYQVRGQDLVNLTIIESDTGVIFYDVEYTAKPLGQSIGLYQLHRGEKPLRGVIISHSHADHFGGFEGIYDAGLATPEDFSSGRIPLIAPANFVEKSVSENVMAGNIMARRAGYQYGNVLEPGERGLVTGALGAALGRLRRWFFTSRSGRRCRWPRRSITSSTISTRCVARRFATHRCGLPISATSSRATVTRSRSTSGRTPGRSGVTRMWSLSGTGRSL